MSLLPLIPLLPAAGAALNGLVGIRVFSKRVAGLVATAAMVSAFGLAALAFVQLLGLPSDARVHDVVLDGVMADANLGNGIWFDVDATALRVVHSDAVRNRANGIQVEISSDVVVVSTTVRDNGLVGLRVLESRQVTISNIVAYRNRTNVAIYEGTRTQDLADVVLANSVVMDSRTGAGALLDVEGHIGVLFLVSLGQYVKRGNGLGIGIDQHAERNTGVGDAFDLSWSDDEFSWVLGTDRRWRRMVSVTHTSVHRRLKEKALGEQRVEI